MRRREFILGIAGLATACPLAARAQQAAKLPTIGILGAATPALEGKWVTAFVQRLDELGWIDGRTVKIEYRWGEGRNDRYAEFAGEFVGLKVDVIVTAGTAGVAVKHATADIPIIFAVAGDPVGSGLVASLARPGGNATGSSLETTDLAGKRLEILREVVPGLHRVAIIGNVSYSAVGLEMKAAQAAATVFGLDMEKLEIRRAEDIAPAVASIKGRAEALYVVAEALLVANATHLGNLALDARLPTMHSFRELVEAKGLMSYGPDFPALWRRAAELVDKILHGARPADIPVEQPTKFDLVVNLSTAKTLGLDISPTLLARADEVIE